MSLTSNDIKDLVELLKQAFNNNSTSNTSTINYNSFNSLMSNLDELNTRLVLVNEGFTDFQGATKEELEKLIENEKEKNRLSEEAKELLQKEIESKKKYEEELDKFNKNEVKLKEEELKQKQHLIKKDGELNAKGRKQLENFKKNNKTDELKSAEEQHLSDEKRLFEKRKEITKFKFDSLDEESKQQLKLREQRKKIGKIFGSDIASRIQGSKGGQVVNAIQGAKGGGLGGKVNAAVAVANMVGEAVSAISNAMTDYKMKDIEMQKENISFQYDIMRRDLQASSKIYTKQLGVYNKILEKQFVAGTSFLTKGVQESAFENASNSITMGGELLKLKIETFFEKLNLESDKFLRTQENSVKIDQLQREQSQGVLNSVLGGIDTITGGIFGGVTGAIKSLTENRNKIATAQNEKYIAQIQNENAYQKELRGFVEQLFNQQIEVLQNFAKQGLEFTNAMENIGLRIDKNIKNGAKIFGTLADKSYENNVKKLQQSLKVNSADGSFYLDKNEEDIIKYQISYVETSGRNIEMTADDTQKAFLMSELWDENTVNSLTAQMDYFNHSIEDSVDMFYEMYQTANRMGISNKKYAETLNKNLKLAQKYTFKGGTESLMKMAIWAEKTRFNMDSLDSMISKVQEGGLEGTITQAAQLQVLGGHAAMGADPLAMQYEAWSDPEAFAERMYNMTREYASFNSKTGEVDITGLNARMVAAIAKAQGRSPEDLRSELTQRMKNEKIDSQINGMGYTDEQKQLLYSKAQYDKNDGRWKININGEKKDINDLSGSDFDTITPVEKNIEDYVYNIWDWLRNQKGAQEFYSTQLGFETKDNTIEQAKQRINTNVVWFNEHAEQLKKIVQTGSEWVTKEDEKWKNLLTNNATNFEESLKSLTTEANKLQEKLDKSISGFNVFSEALTKSADEMIKAVENWCKENLEIDISDITMDIETRQMKKSLLDSFEKNGNDISKGNLQKMFTGERGMTAEQRLDAFMTNYAFTQMSKSEQDLIKNNRTKFINLIEKMIEQGEIDALPTPQKSNPNNSWNQQKTSGQVASDLGSEAIKNGNYGEASVYYFAAGASSMKDGIASSNGSSMLTAASNVTPIHDGSVQLAKSDPQDTAIFAKAGGPFDTLFNGIFAKINDIHQNIVPKGMEYTMPLEINGNRETGNKYTSNNSKLQIETVKVEINGKLELTSSNGQSIDIIGELKNNPLLLRQLTQMISENVSKSINGGRATYDGTTTTARFNGMGI